MRCEFNWKLPTGFGHPLSYSSSSLFHHWGSRDPGRQDLIGHAPLRLVLWGGRTVKAPLQSKMYMGYQVAKAVSVHQWIFFSQLSGFTLHFPEVVPCTQDLYIIMSTSIRVKALLPHNQYVQAYIVGQNYV